MCLAGPVATQKITGIEVTDQPGSRDDIAKARTLLSKVGARDIDAVTRMLIAHNWPYIWRIACRLVDCRELTYAEVLALLP